MSVVFHHCIDNGELPESDAPNSLANLPHYEIFPPGKICSALTFCHRQEYPKDFLCRETISLGEGLSHVHVALAASTPYLQRVAMTYAT